MGVASAVASDSMKVNFLSIIKQARVAESGKKYAEYEIASNLRVPASIHRDRVLKWSVWKRYSDFEALDSALRKSLGWQMDGIEFPSSHSLAFNKFSSTFIEQRKYVSDYCMPAYSFFIFSLTIHTVYCFCRVDLNAYWQQLILIDKVVEFSKHHCSAELKAFLDVDAQIAAFREKVCELSFALYLSVLR